MIRFFIVSHYTMKSIEQFKNSAVGLTFNEHHDAAGSLEQTHHFLK